jgi:Fe-S cluster biogenesis protein NfuA
MEMETPDKDFYLEFLGACTDAAVADYTLAQVIILLERLH